MRRRMPQPRAIGASRSTTDPPNRAPLPVRAPRSRASRAFAFQSLRGTRRSWFGPATVCSPRPSSLLRERAECHGKPHQPDSFPFAYASSDAEALGGNRVRRHDHPLDVPLVQNPRQSLERAEDRIAVDVLSCLLGIIIEETDWADRQQTIRKRLAQRERPAMARPVHQNQLPFGATSLLPMPQQAKGRTRAVHQGEQKKGIDDKKRELHCLVEQQSIEHEAARRRENDGHARAEEILHADVPPRPSIQPRRPEYENRHGGKQAHQTKRQDPFPDEEPIVVLQADRCIERDEDETQIEKHGKEGRSQNGRLVESQDQATPKHGELVVSEARQPDEGGAEKRREQQRRLSRRQEHRREPAGGENETHPVQEQDRAAVPEAQGDQLVMEVTAVSIKESFPWLAVLALAKKPAEHRDGGLGNGQPKNDDRDEDRHPGRQR